jgi:hypothetical protein
MGPKPAWRAAFAGGLLGAFVLLAPVMPAHAQQADAGVEQKAATPPPPPPAEPPPSQEPPPGGDPSASPDPSGSREASGVLPKAINPNQLSEGARARLAERAAGRHPSSLAAREPTPRQELPREAAPGAAAQVPPYRPVVGGGEPLRRGQARMRVQAVETDEGVTLLSNRIQLPERSLSAAVAKRPAPDPEPPVTEEAVAAADLSSVTETHSLRPSSARNARANNTSTGLGWLLWPFVLFVTTGAVMGTLWFRRKTE